MDALVPGGAGGPVGGPSSAGQIPLTAEWFERQKKLLKQAGMEEATSIERADTYTPSEAAKKLPSTPSEKFLHNVKASILAMDPNSETFLPEATEKLVGGVLEQEYGEHVLRDPGYPQMQEKITRTLLEDERYREIITDFLEVLLMSQGQAPPLEGQEEQ